MYSSYFPFPIHFAQCHLQINCGQCVYLEHQRIGEIHGFEYLKSVTELTLRNNLISRIEGLSCLASTLLNLDMYDNRLKKIENLEELTLLEWAIHLFTYVWINIRVGSTKWPFIIIILVFQIIRLVFQHTEEDWRSRDSDKTKKVIFGVEQVF